MCIWCCLVYKQIKSWVASLPHQLSTGLGSFPRKPMAQEAATCPPPSQILQGLWLLSANQQGKVHLPAVYCLPWVPAMLWSLHFAPSYEILKFAYSSLWDCFGKKVKTPWSCLPAKTALSSDNLPPLKMTKEEQEDFLCSSMPVER